MKKNIYFLGNIIVIILAFVMYGVVEQFYFFPNKIIKNYHLNTSIYLALTLIVTLVILFILLQYYRGQLNRKNDWQFNEKPHWSTSRVLLAVVAAFVMLLSEIALILILHIGINTTSTNQADLNAISKHAGSFYIPMITVIAPVFEETIFRGLFFNMFFSDNTDFNKWVGILASGFVFGFAHDPGLTKFILIYWLLGCILAWVYIQTKDLRYSVITHVLFNSLGFI